MRDRPGQVAFPDDVVRALSAGEGIGQIELTGSRASGLARPQSDWDFTIATTAFPEVRDAMPRLVAGLHPVMPSGTG